MTRSELAAKVDAILLGAEKGMADDVKAQCRFFQPEDTYGDRAAAVAAIVALFEQAMP